MVSKTNVLIICFLDRKTHKPLKTTLEFKKKFKMKVVKLYPLPVFYDLLVSMLRRRINFMLKCVLTFTHKTPKKEKSSKIITNELSKSKKYFLIN